MPAALDIKEEILELKKQRNAVILAHNYQTGDIQDLADYVGDSLGLAYQAKSTDADVIVFGGLGLIFDDYYFFRSTFEDEGIMGRTVMYVNQASDPIVERLLVPDADHMESSAVDPKRYWDTVYGFIRRSFKI